MSLTEKKVELFSPPPPYILLSVWMMMELFNDYGTFTYKILQNKNKKFSKKQNEKIWAHNLQNFHDAGKLCTLL